MLSDTMMLGGGRKAAYSIENSLLFRGGQYLKRTFAQPTNQMAWTFSTWIRRSALVPGSYVDLMCSSTANNAAHMDIMLFNDAIVIEYGLAGISGNYLTGPLLRDTGAWYHIVVAADLTQPTAADRIKVYVNGAQVALSGTQPLQNSNWGFNSAVHHTLGDEYASAASAFFQGYMAEVAFVDGAALPPFRFGETDPLTGSWRPKKLAGITGGTNGFYLGEPWDSTDLGIDYGAAAPTFLREATSSVVTLSNSGLTGSTTTVGPAYPFVGASSTFDIATAKLEWQVTAGTGNVSLIGIAKADKNLASASNASDTRTYQLDGQKVSDGTPAAYGASYTVGDKIKVRVDHGSLEFFKWVSGAWVSQGVAFTGLTGRWRPCIYLGINQSGTVDFGQSGFTATSGYSLLSGGNGWWPSGFAATDVVKDSPTNVYATFNPLVSPANGTNSATYSQGNLTISGGTGSVSVSSRGTLLVPPAGKWAFQITKPASSGTASGSVSDGFAYFYWMAGFVKASLSGRDVDSTNHSNFCGLTDTGVIGDFGAGGFASAPALSAAGTLEIMADFDANTMTVKQGSTVYHSWSIVNPGEPVVVYARAFDVGNTTVSVDYTPSIMGYKSICTANLPATAGATGGSFIGNANADGPCIYTGAVPQTLTVNGNAVTWGTHADKLAAGFKIRTASTSYNGTGANTWTATYDKKPTVGPKGHAPANAQVNP